MVGDEHARVTEAVKAAERHLKCKVLRTSPYWSKEGYSKKMHNKEVRVLFCSWVSSTSLAGAHKVSALEAQGLSAAATCWPA